MTKPPSDPIYPCRPLCHCWQYGGPDEKTEDKVTTVYQMVIILAPKPVRWVDWDKILRMG